MIFSPEGALICVLILAIVRLTGWSIVVAFMASLAFGATAIGTLGSLGGSSPLIYTVFAVILVASSVLRRDIWRELGVLFIRIGAATMMVALMIYVVIGAVLLPRLFAGQTSVFVASRTGRGVYETALEPVSANISQSGYFVLGGLVFLALCLRFQREDVLTDVRRGFFVWFTLHAAMGSADLFAKLAGMGDVLAPIRTASYAMLTNNSEGGFWKIAGAYSEASAFGAASLAGLAFSYTYWRETGSRYAAGLALVILALLLLSTATTSYVGLAILGLFAAGSVARSFTMRRLTARDLWLVAILGIAGIGVLTTLLHSPHFFDPFLRLVDAMVTNKMSSASGQERAYWNYKSFQAFLDTGGLGIGIGSSRASSFAIAVISQVGMIGAAMLAGLITMLAVSTPPPRSGMGGDVYAIFASTRACALASLLAIILAGGSADPGMTFFVGLAAVLSNRACVSRRSRPTLQKPVPRPR